MNPEIFRIDIQPINFCIRGHNINGIIRQFMENVVQLLNYRKEQDKMPIHIIPVDKLSADALDGVIKEFISRNGTDYGEFEAAMETKVRQVKQKLEKGLAVLVYDDEMETTNIFRHDDPILRKLE
jgi:uncharacterized protein YheU (UPF0270 family)